MSEVWVLTKTSLKGPTTIGAFQSLKNAKNWVYIKTGIKPLPSSADSPSSYFVHLGSGINYVISKLEVLDEHSSEA